MTANFEISAVVVVVAIGTGSTVGVGWFRFYWLSEYLHADCFEDPAKLRVSILPMLKQMRRYILPKSATTSGHYTSWNLVMPMTFLYHLHIMYKE